MCRKCNKGAFNSEAERLENFNELGFGNNE